MKKLFIPILILTAFISCSKKTIPLTSVAPKPGILLADHQLLKFVTTVKGTVSQEALGINMDVIMDVTSNKNLLVTSTTKEKYTIDYTATRLKMNMTAMDKTTTFDSDNTDDMKGEMKDAGKDINVTKKLELTPDGICNSLDTDHKTVTKESSDMMGNIMQQFTGSGNDEATVESYFMLLAVNKKLGDTWSDSTISSTIKKYNIYTWDSTVNNVAKISITQKMINDIKTEMMGMDVASNITSDIIEIRQVDLKTGIILSKRSTTKMNGTAEMMGMSIPITGTITTEVLPE